MEDMKLLVLALIKAMENKKKEENISPSHVTMSEINQVIKQSLRELYNEGKIKTGKTLNDHYVESISPTKENQ